MSGGGREGEGRSGKHSEGKVKGKETIPTEVREGSHGPKANDKAQESTRASLGRGENGDSDSGGKAVGAGALQGLGIEGALKSTAS